MSRFLRQGRLFGLAARTASQCGASTARRPLLLQRHGRICATMPARRRLLSTTSVRADQERQQPAASSAERDEIELAVTTAPTASTTLGTSSEVQSNTASASASASNISSDADAADLLSDQPEPTYHPYYRPLKQLTMPRTRAPLRFDPVRLRDSCTCPKCVDEHSGQKRFSTAQIPSASELRWSSARFLISPEAQERSDAKELLGRRARALTQEAAELMAQDESGVVDEIEDREGIGEDGVESEEEEARLVSEMLHQAGVDKKRAAVLSGMRVKDQTFEVVWEDDFLERQLLESGAGGNPSKRHISRYPAIDAYLAMKAVQPRLRLPSAAAPQRIQRRLEARHLLWDARVLRGLMERRWSRVTFDDWVRGGQGFRKAFFGLSKNGICLIEDVPAREDSVERLAGRVGRIMETIYGRTWDVVAKPRAENVAYTDIYLPLHQDLMYLQTPPKLQFLHCLENSVSGGESIFVDGYQAAELMRAEYPREFETLTRFDVYYHYTKAAYRLNQFHPVITQRNGVVNRIAWAPPFQGPQDMENRGTTFAEWHAAARLWDSILAREDLIWQHRLLPGQCIVFDNMRILHGRRRFDASTGRRWLKGTYVNANQVHDARVRLRIGGKRGFGGHLTRDADLDEDALLTRDQQAPRPLSRHGLREGEAIAAAAVPWESARRGSRLGGGQQEGAS